MYFTYVVRPGSSPGGRSPQFKPIWDTCLETNLRTGTLLQLASFVTLVAISILGNNSGIGFVHLSTSDDRMTSSFLALLAVLASLSWVFAATCINSFRNYNDDESAVKLSRGYRTGTKLMAHASFLDIIQAGLLALFFLAQFSYFEDAWQTESVSPNVMTIYGNLSRILHAMSLLLYGGSFFMVEAYHTHGTAEYWSWTLATLFKAAACLEVLALATDCRLVDAVFTCVYAIGLLAAFVWAQSFEPLVRSSETELDKSALRTEYFKASNSMAYYGPDIIPGMQLVAAQEEEEV